MITGKTKLLGVIGHPIEHSLSPIMHNAAIAHLGLDYAYLPLPVKPENLAEALRGFAAIDLQGFNITIPHKQSIMPLLSQLSEVAEAVGAVNTVWRTEQGWNGTNTDVAGFLAPLGALDRPWGDTIALILGNGGAARAVVAGCAQLGITEIHVIGRDIQKLQAFQHSWHSPLLKAALQVHSWERVSELLPHAGLLVNTTPIGMAPHADRSPLTAAEMERFSTNGVAYDLIYTPNPTVFLQSARDQGATAIDGLEMLVYQGAAALEIWLRQPAPVEVMRTALHQHLGWKV